nr:winged helix DNA-binding protein [Roseomonas acroporae]
MHGFQRWVVRCMAAAGMAGLSPLEVQVLHVVRHRDRPKRLADIALMLDIGDAHLLTYALRKLEGAGLVATSRAGKEKLVAATAAGVALCTRYGEIRELLLVRALRAGTGGGPAGLAAVPGEAALSDLAALLRSLAGLYDQASRAAATL